MLNRYLQLPPVVGARNETGVTPSDPTKPFRAQGTVEVFRCPSDRGSFISSTNLSETVFSSHWDYYGTSYRTNRLVIGPTPPRPTDNDPCYQVLDEFIRRFDKVTISLSSLSNESRLVLMGDFPFDGWQNPGDDKPPLEYHARAYRQVSWSGYVSSSGSVTFDFQRATKHNIAFVDGHAALTDVRKGIYVSASYTVVPFKDLQAKFASSQHAGYYPP
jgi:prepilin-type processing-associated H-X9-DG protein